MTTPSDDPRVPDEGAERRLHPLSWLFVALQQLKSFALPLFVLIVTGRGNRFEWVGLFGVTALAAVAIVQYATYRFRLGPEGVVITSGVVQRTRRDIPYERIHNVGLHQSLLHRLFGVAEVRLESAGGKKAEAEMRVLSLEDAQAVETLIRARGLVTPRADSAADPMPLARAEPLLTMDTWEIVRLGLISNRGMVLVAATFGAMWQVLPDGASPDDMVRGVYAYITRESAHLAPAWLLAPSGVLSASFVLILLTLIVVRALSVALALAQFHGFTLQQTGKQLRIERGLLTRVRMHLPRARIQAWRMSETLLHRWFGRRSLRVDNATSAEGEDGRAARDLAPLATPAAMDELVAHLLPGSVWPPTDWRPLHPRAWRRLIVAPTTAVVAAASILTWHYGGTGLIPLILVPMVFVRARLWARYAGHAEVAGQLIATREGWINKSWRWNEIRKIQTIRLTESPFDRRHGMVTVWIDTAGAGARDGVMRIPFLPSTEARALQDRLLAVPKKGTVPFSQT